jgi:hypothetical protein
LHGRPFCFMTAGQSHYGYRVVVDGRPAAAAATACWNGSVTTLSPRRVSSLYAASGQTTAGPSLRRLLSLSLSSFFCHSTRTVGAHRLPSPRCSYTTSQQGPSWCLSFFLEILLPGHPSFCMHTQIALFRRILRILVRVTARAPTRLPAPSLCPGPCSLIPFTSAGACLQLYMSRPPVLLLYCVPKLTLNSIYFSLPCSRSSQRK